jgi:hypothetical protein
MEIGQPKLSERVEEVGLFVIATKHEHRAVPEGGDYE